MLPELDEWMIHRCAGGLIEGVRRHYKALTDTERTKGGPIGNTTLEMRERHNQSMTVTLWHQGTQTIRGRY